jgi:hypothetical protein
MTGRRITPAQLPQLGSILFANHHTIALTPATDDAAWAAPAIWAAARAAAAAGRQVLLVDLGLESPGLDQGAIRLNPRGIAEAFTGDLQLHDVAAEQEVAGLHYIGRGATGGDPASLWNSDRWARLARGFASQGALLLLAMPPAALAALRLDGLALMVFAPSGYDPAGGTFPRIAERIAAGAPLIAVVARTAPASRISSPSRARRVPRRKNRSPALAGIAGLIVVLGAGAVLWGRRAEKASLQETRPARVSAPAVSVPPPAPDPADSLYYSVQVAAHDQLAQAMAHAAEIEKTGRIVIVTPVQVGNQGVWYRVLVGALQDAHAADSVLQDLWQNGVLERPQGTILRAPQAFRLRASRGDLAGLRARGIPAYIVLALDSTDQVYVGAFDLAEQARAIDSLLTAADLSGTLVRRTGFSQ